MHPRGVTWFVSADTLARGMPVAAGVVRHLILTQPVLEDLIPAAEQDEMHANLKAVDAFSEFLNKPY